MKADSKRNYTHPASIIHDLEQTYAVDMINTRQYNIIANAIKDQENIEPRNMATTTVEYNSTPVKGGLDYEFVIRIKCKRPYQ